MKRFLIFSVIAIFALCLTCSNDLAVQQPGAGDMPRLIVTVSPGNLSSVLLDSVKQQRLTDTCATNDPLTFFGAITPATIPAKRMTWNFGDSTKADSATAHHRYGKSGVYHPVFMFVDTHDSSLSNDSITILVVSSPDSVVLLSPADGAVGIWQGEMLRWKGYDTFTHDTGLTYTVLIVRQNGTIDTVAAKDTAQSSALAPVYAKGEHLSWSVTARDRFGHNVTSRTSSFTMAIAVFVIDTFAVTINEQGKTANHAPRVQAAVYGIPLLIDAKAHDDSSYYFVNWTVSAGQALIADSLMDTTRITLRNGNATIIARFSDKVVLTLSVDGQGTAVSPSSPDVVFNRPQTVTATASAGNVFDRWLVAAGQAALTDTLAASTTARILSPSAELRARFVQQSIPFDRITLADVRSHPLFASPLNGTSGAANQLPAEAVVVYKTSQGRFGKLKVLDNGFYFVILAAVFDTDGSLLSKGIRDTVAGSSTFNLDTRTMQSDLPADFAWQDVAGQRLLTPRNGALFAVYDEGFDTISVKSIKAAPLSAAQLSAKDTTGNRIPVGTILDYKTNAGRYGKAKILMYGTNLVFTWVTYDSLGAIFHFGERDTVGLTWCFDFDSTGSKQCGAGADIWYQEMPGNVRYLTTQNGALQAIVGP